MTQYILGINAFHADASAAIFSDGQLLAAVEEERFRRIKHWAGFPTEAIRYCLEAAGIRLGEVQHVAVNTQPSAQRWQRLRYVLRHRPSLGLVRSRLRSRARRRGLGDWLASSFPAERFSGEIHYVEHHLAHLASAFFQSPFERAAVVSVDGFGDFCSAAWGVGEASNIALAQRVLFPHSLGIFYEALTQYLGFPNYGDEYKVMGLAASGKPAYAAQMRDIVRLTEQGRFELGLNYFRHASEHVPYQWEDGAPQVGGLWTPALEALLGPARRPDDPLDPRHRDIAASTQAIYEEAFFHLLRAAHRHSGGDALCLAGGCAMNSVANGKLTLRTPFRRVYVQAAAGDAGGAVGAAAVVAAELGSRPGGMSHAYWGPSFDPAAIRHCLETRRGELDGCRVDLLESEPELCARSAAAIGAGKVVGWMQGRMEWGPRALGNRSILCDPLRGDMKDILNLKIKRRESFRPFAPSVLREHVAEWFEQDADVPFMTQVFQIRVDKRALIPAVTHVDGSGRLQTVERSQNPRYYGLIREFHSMTGVPMVLNTSFNENEPIVCRPEEALDCFLRTRMDLLVLGDYFIERG